MADAKVSELVTATSLGGSDVFYLVQSNTSKKISAASFFANAANVVLSGNTTFGGTPQTLGAPGIININTPITQLSVDAIGGTLQIPQGADGQIKIVTMTTAAGGTYTFNTSNIAGNVNVSLDSVGDTVVLFFTGGKWHPLTSSTGINLTSISSNVIPSANNTFDLGSPTNQWNSLYVSNNTIFIGGTPLTIENGELVIGTGEASAILATVAYVDAAVANAGGGAGDNSNVSNVIIVTDSAGDAYTWTFDLNGDLTAPGSITTGTNGGRFVQDCGDGITSIRWINIDENNDAELLRFYTGDPGEESGDAERAQIRLNWQSADQSGLTIKSFDQDSNEEHDWEFRGDGKFTAPGDIEAYGNISTPRLIVDGDNFGGGLEIDTNFFPRISTYDTLSLGSRSFNTSLTANAFGTAKTWNFQETGVLSVPGKIENIDSLKLDTSAGISVSEGEIAWNSSDGTIDIGLAYGDVVLQVGQETHYVVRNATGNTILNGTAVYCSGVTGGSGRIEIDKMESTIDPVQFLGLATQNINNGVNGVVTYFGYVRELDTRGTANTAISVGDENWQVGDKLYVHPTAPGKLTKVEPQAPNVKICVASVIIRNQTSGKLFVRPTTNLTLPKLSDVHVDSPTNGQLLQYVSANSRWENTSDISANNLVITETTSLTKPVEVFSSIADATGVVTHDCSTGQIFNHTSIDDNFTANFTNLNLGSGKATTITLVLNQGGTAYIANAVQIQASAQTIKWSANTVPTGNVNAVDVVSFSIFNNSGTYTVLGQLSTFG